MALARIPTHSQGHSKQPTPAHRTQDQFVTEELVAISQASKDQSCFNSALMGQLASLHASIEQLKRQELERLEEGDGLGIPVTSMGALEQLNDDLSNNKTTRAKLVSAVNV